jgi:hypothetical protein
MLFVIDVSPFFPHPPPLLQHKKENKTKESRRKTKDTHKIAPLDEFPSTGGCCCC